MSTRPDRARIGLFVVALLLAGLLVGTNLWLYVGVTDRARELAQAQGQVFAMALVASTPPGPPEPGVLQTLLTQHHDDGLRWIGMLDHDGEARFEVGERLPSDTMPTDAEPLLELPGTDDDHTRVRYLLAPPPRPFDGRRPPPLVIEFVPVGAHDLRARSARALAVALAGGLVLLGAAWSLGRQLRRAARIEQDLAQHRHLAGLGQMSAVLAHEIRNPLAALKGHAQLLAELLPADDRRRTRADRVVHEAERLERLTNDLLDFARTGSLVRVEVDPAEPLRAALAALPGGEAESSRILLQLDGPPRFVLDPARLTQVLSNLLENALQAAPDTPVTVSLTRADGGIRYVVRDHGPGVPPGEEERIFEAFHTHRTRGTGLGLAVARHIVTLHRGTIRARNHPDGGAELTVWLPENL